MLPDVPGGAERHVGAAGEGQHAVDRGRHLDLDHLAAARFAGHGAGGACGRGLGADPGDRPEQVDQLGHVVRPDVVDRAAAPLEEELGIWVPVLHPVRQHGRGAGDRTADPAGIDRPPAGLMRGTEEGIGRAADAYAFAGGGEHQRLALGEACGQRLLGIDVLAGGDDLPAHRAVRQRHGQIDDDLDVRIGEQRLDRNRRDAVFARPCLGGLGTQIGAGLDPDQLRARGALEVGVADVAAADDADDRGLHDRVRLPCQ